MPDLRTLAASHLCPGYVYLGRRRGVQLVNPTDQIPGILSSDMLVERALYYVCEWAEKNKGRYPQLRASDWRYMQSAHDKSYRDMLRDAKRQDDELMFKHISHLNGQTIYS